MKVTRAFSGLFFFAMLSSVSTQVQFGSGYAPIDSATALELSPSANDTVLETAVYETQIDDIVRRMLDEQQAIAALTKEAGPKPTFPDLKMTGFFQRDTARFGQSGNNIATLGDIQDTTSAICMATTVAMGLPNELHSCRLIVVTRLSSI